MKRGMLLGALVGVALLSVAIAGYQAPAGGGQQQQGPKVVEVQKVKDNLFMLTGQNSGGNTAVFIMTDGITVVDTKNPGWGKPILDKIKELSPKPVVRIINTHTHGDHVSGNVEFPATVDVIVQENTAANMKKMTSPPASPGGQPGPSIFQQNQGRGLPKQTFKDKMTLGKGADQIDLYYFGAGHTNGDAWVVFPALRTVHAGDIFAGKSLPLLDGNNGGSGVAIPDSLSKAHAGIKNVDTIITGHSTLMTWNDLQEYAAFNRDFLNAVRDGVKAGKSAEEIAKNWTMPAKYKGYAAPQANRTTANVQLIVNELKK